MTTDWLRCASISITVHLGQLSSAAHASNCMLCRPPSDAGAACRAAFEARHRTREERAAAAASRAVAAEAAERRFRRGYDPEDGGAAAGPEPGAGSGWRGGLPRGPREGERAAALVARRRAEEAHGLAAAPCRRQEAPLRNQS